MIGKIVFLGLLVALLGLSSFYFYQSLPQPPINLEIQYSPSEPTEMMEYGATPVFSENLRFNHNNISFFIDMATCSAKEASKMVEAFNIFQEEMELINFIQYYSEDNADIKISCPERKVELGDSLFAAGEGGPSEIINTTLFKTIREGRIYLYESPKCDYPIVEIHELGHVFGFDHSPNPKNIMYNTSNCNQRISDDMVQLINDLYSIVPLPELRISELEAVKRGKYLDFNVTVLNEGLLEVKNVSLTLSSNSEEIEKVYLGEIGIGYGRTIRAANVKLPSRDSEEIEFMIDIENIVREYDKENNLVKMTVQTQ
jgi:hypothetical protein